MFNLFKKKNQQPAELFFHTDIHCHLVPGIDDGQEDAHEAATLVERAKSWGITRIICTPHITQDTFENTPDTIRPAFEALTQAIAERGIDIDIDYSAEHRLDPFFLSELEKGHIRPYPNNYLLVENSFIQEMFNLDQTLFDLRTQGYKLILAHPERYFYYWEKKYARYHQLHSIGIRFQANLLSFSGYYGKDVKKTVDYLLANDMIDFVGTDMHHTGHASAIESFLHTKDYRRLADTLAPRILNDTAFLPSNPH